MNKLLLKEGIKCKGSVSLRVYDEYMNPLYNEWQHFPNIITTLGYGELCDVLISEKTISYIGVGYGTTTPALTDIDLESPITSRKIITDSSRTGAICLFSVFFGTTDNNPESESIGWSESILATGSEGANIISHALFTNIFYKTNKKQCYVDWSIELS